jgi:hypothetical protein
LTLSGNGDGDMEKRPLISNQRRPFSTPVTGLEWLTDTNLGRFVDVASVYTHLNSGNVKTLKAAAPGNSQQDQ